MTLIGFVLSALTMAGCKLFTDLSLLAYNGVVVCVACGYAVSFLFPPASRPLAGLTVHTLPEKAPAT